MSFDGGTLTLNTDLLLSEENAVVQKVINGEIRCDKLVILGTASTFHRIFIGSDSYGTFWMKLGETVTSLEIHERTTIDLGLYLSNVRSLSIVKPGIYQDTLLNLSERNVALEELSIDENLIDFGLPGPKEVDSNFEFFRMLENLNFSLKCVTSECSIPLQHDEIGKLCSELKQSFQGLDEVMFDCEPLPKFSSWLIEKAGIEFAKGGNSRKLIFKPLFLRQLSYEERRASRNKDCDFQHKVFKSGSVKRLCFKENEYNLDFCLNSLKSFSSVEEVKSLPTRAEDVSLLHFISKHMHLKDLSMDVHGYYSRRLWPLCTTVENVTITCKEIFYLNFERLNKSFPNLRKLSIEINGSSILNTMFKHDCVELTVKNAKKLEYLSLKCPDNKLTSRGLDLIRCNLKDLKELHMSCTASYTDIENLFEELPTLEVFYYGHSTLYRRFLNHQPLPNEKGINDLPFELIERIFLYLTNNEQRTCRQVCKHWFNVQESSPKIDYALNLTETTYFSYEKEPVNIFINTNFKYKKIIINNTIFCSIYEDLSEFWKKIGAEVKEIVLFQHKGRYYVNKKVGLKAKHFPKLKKLKVESLSLLYQLQDIPKWKALLDQVETFTINVQEEDTCGFEFSMSNVTQLQATISPDSGAAFQRISFPKLQTLNIFHQSSQCLNFTNINYAQIKTLQFRGYMNATYIDLIIENCPNLECLTIWDIGKISDLQKKLFDKLLNLKHLNFVECWSTFDWILFHRTSSGIEKTDKFCRELYVISLMLNFIDYLIDNAK